MRLLLTVVAAVLAAPAISAQGGPLGPELTLGFEAPTEPLRPGADVATVVATAVARCDVVLQADSTSSTTSALLHLEVPDSLLVIGPMTSLVDKQTCLTGATHANLRTEFQVAPRPDAPGLQTVPVTGTMRLGDVESTPSEFDVKVAYFALTQVQVADKLASCSGPCRLDFVLEVSNFGNARTTVTFDLADKPQDGGWGVRMPEPIVTVPRLAGGAPVSVVVSVEVPGGNAKSGAFTLTIHQEATEQPDLKGAPLSVSVLARNANLVSRATPEPTPLLVGLTCVAAALLARRRA